MLRFTYFTTSAYLVPPRADRPRPVAGVKPAIPCDPDSFTIALKATKPLRCGEHVWLNYGKGSSHNKVIKAAVEEHAAKAPSRAAVAKKRRFEHAAMMRAAKEAKAGQGGESRPPFYGWNGSMNGAVGSFGPGFGTGCG